MKRPDRKSQMLANALAAFSKDSSSVPVRNTCIPRVVLQLSGRCHAHKGETTF